MPESSDKTTQSGRSRIPGFADTGTYKHRLSTCKACEHLDKTLWQCRECKCLVFVKTRLINARCPLGYW